MVEEYTRAPFLLVAVCREKYRVGAVRHILKLVGEGEGLAAALKSRSEIDEQAAASSK